ncbi:MAG: AsmA family protein [Rhodobacteraceae bacterium]|jgi:AsmA protein|nr:AsmA family protein [Paracoccaceae bacterium]
MRWIVRLIGLLVFLVVVVVAAIFLVPADRIANLAARQFEAATGRALTITGSVSPTIWPSIGARIEGVTLANMSGSDAGPMFTAQSVDLGVNLSALVGGAVSVQRFEVQQPQIILERDANGRGNWVFEGLGGGEATAPVEGGGSGGLPAISLDRALISNASLRFIDHAAGTDITVDGVDLELTMPDTAGPADLRLTARRGGQTGRIEAHVGSVAGLLAGDVVAIAATLSADGAEARFEGRAGLEPLAAEGRISFEGSRLAPALALAGIAGAEPLPAAARPLTLGGQVTLAPAGSLHLREGVIGVGTSRIRAALDLVTSGDRPNLTGEIGADSLDLRPFLEGGGDASASGGTGWPTDRIDASALGLMDARIGLTLGPVQTGFADLDSLRGALVIDRSRAVLELAEVRAFEGALAGELVANNRSGLSVGGTMQLRNVQLLPLLRQAAEFERLTGTASMDLRFLGSGSSVDAIMHSLEGTGRLDFGAGEIIGFDLAGMLRNLDASYVGEGNRTIFESLTGSFTMQGGVLRNEDLALAASLVTVAGRGTVDLGEQVLDYRVTPEAMRNADTGAALRVPLLITGPWSAPRFRLDLEGLAEQRLSEERERLEAAARAEADRLEAEARARVQERIEDGLGVTLQDGQSTEDALRQGVEDAVRNRLNRLLGGSDPAPDAAPDAAPEN